MVAVGLEADPNFISPLCIHSHQSYCVDVHDDGFLLIIIVLETSNLQQGFWFRVDVSGGTQRPQNTVRPRFPICPFQQLLTSLAVPLTVGEVSQAVAASPPRAGRVSSRSTS